MTGASRWSLAEAAVLPLGGRGAVVLDEERVLVHALRPDHLMGRLATRRAPP